MAVSRLMGCSIRAHRRKTAVNGRNRPTLVIANVVPEHASEAKPDTAALVKP